MQCRTVHELAITQSVVAQVAERLGDTRVRVVTLEIGQLSGVVADSVRFCFDLCAEGTSLEGARLDILDIPGRALCRRCRTDFALSDHVMLCSCGSADLEITGGQELTIKTVEVI